MKKTLCLLLILVLGCTILSSSAAASSSSLRIVIASDTHYIAPSLTDGGAYYQRVLQNGDSKFMPYSEEILSAFIDEVLADPPDALILTGDLTFNGAIISHEALIEKLRVVKSAGIPVLVQTGNHDVFNSNAARFFGNSFSRIPSATTETFSVLYDEFGPHEAVSRDNDSLSYLYPLTDSTWVLMLDLNTEHDFCGLSDPTLYWIEQQLRNAAKAGVRIIAAGHQNLFQHTIFRDGYVIDKAERLAVLFRKYGISLYLSGHLHIQNIRTEEGLTEIASSALCSYPCQYGILVVGDGCIRYKAKRLDMKAWAERYGRNDPVFQDFTAAAGDYMDAHFRANEMVPLTEDAQLWQEMLQYLNAVNRAYFSGDLRELDALDPDGVLAALWLQPGDLTAYYLRTVLADAESDYTAWEASYQGA